MATRDSPKYFDSVHLGIAIVLGLLAMAVLPIVLSVAFPAGVGAGVFLLLMVGSEGAMVFRTTGRVPWVAIASAMVCVAIILLSAIRPSTDGHWPLGLTLLMIVELGMIVSSALLRRAEARNRLT